MASKHGKECTRCLLHENVPGVTFHDDKLCSVCHQFDVEWGNWNLVKEQRLTQLNKMFDDCRSKKRPYDVLVPLSGGKDSIYVLYQCVKKFNLKCLSVTWDNGFLSSYAKENIKRAVDILGVDHFYYRVNWPLLKKLYKHFFLKTGMFCPVCMRGISVATASAAEAFNIPLVVNGTCLRNEEFVSPEFFNSGPIHFFREVLKDDPLEQEATSFFYSGSKKRVASYYFFWWTHIQRVHFYATINLPDYIDWNYDEIFKVISEEVEWKAERIEAEHSDCKVSPIVDYLRQKKFPALVPEMLRYSKLATANIITKEKAHQKVIEVQKEIEKKPVNLNEFLKIIGITQEELDDIINDPFRHVKFIKEEHSTLFRIARTIKRFFFPKR